MDKCITNPNLQQLDLNKEIQELEKILENIKYEYKLSSHIARFHKYIDDKKTYIVKIKINDEPCKFNIQKTLIFKKLLFKCVIIL